MYCKLLTKKDQPVFKWQGGITKQLFVYPEGSNGVGNGSLFEVTSSTMDFPKTEYTLFENFKRILMVIDGTTTLSHKDGTSKTLRKYDYHAFHGNLQTYSDGLATDYEIIFDEKLVGRMQVVSDEECDLPCSLSDTRKKIYLGFYCDGEKADIIIDEKCYHIANGDHLSVIVEEYCNIRVAALKSTVINSIIEL